MSDITLNFNGLGRALAATALAVSSLAATAQGSSPAPTPVSPASTVGITKAGEAFLGAGLTSFYAGKISRDSGKPMAIITREDCRAGPSKDMLVSLRDTGVQSVSMIALDACRALSEGRTNAREAIGRDGQSVGIILMNSYGAKGEDAFRKLAGLPSWAKIEGVGGSAADWQAFMLGHETTHMTESHFSDAASRLSGRAEIRADTGGDRFYAEALAARVVKDPAVPVQLREARVLANFFLPGTQGHDVAGARHIYGHYRGAPTPADDGMLGYKGHAYRQATGEVHLEAIKLAEPQLHARLVATVALQEMSATKLVPASFIQGMQATMAAAIKGDTKAGGALQEFAEFAEAGGVIRGGARVELLRVAAERIYDSAVSGRHIYANYLPQAARNVLAGSRLEGIAGGSAAVTEFLEVAQRRVPDLMPAPGPETVKLNRAAAFKP